MSELEKPTSTWARLRSKHALDKCGIDRTRCKVEGPRESAKAALVGTSQRASYHCG
jgi:hypothetical protein